MEKLYLEKNIKLYKYYFILSKSLLIWPIIIIFLKDIGLSLFQIMLLNGIESFFSVVLEVPTGIVADKWGNKKSIVMGIIFEILTFSIYIFTSDFNVLIIGSILGALSSALLSGADMSLIYKSHKELGKEEKFNSYMADIQSKKFIFVAITAVFSSILYTINIYIPIILSIISLILSFFISLKFYENSNENRVHNTYKNYVGHIKDALKLIKKENITKIIIIYVIFTIFISNINFLSQPYMVEINIPVIYFGAIFFTFNIIASFGAKRSTKLKKKFGDKAIYVLMIAIFVVCLLISLTHNWIGIFILMCSRLITGMTWPILDTELNNSISNDNYRATIISVNSLFIQLSFVLFDPMIGYFTDKFNIFLTYFILAIGMIIIIIAQKTNYLNDSISNKQVSE